MVASNIPMLLGIKRSGMRRQRRPSKHTESSALTAWPHTIAYLQVLACSCSSCCELNVLPQALHLYSAMVFPFLVWANRLILTHCVPTLSGLHSLSCDVSVNRPPFLSLVLLLLLAVRHSSRLLDLTATRQPVNGRRAM
jgi:hypothetical protein